jgi:hypothetical protein
MAQSLLDCILENDRSDSLVGIWADLNDDDFFLGSLECRVGDITMQGGGESDGKFFFDCFDEIESFMVEYCEGSNDLNLRRQAATVLIAHKNYEFGNGKV